ncbi:MAG TPA: gliding motility lipoprotein GldH [Salinimicrobium sp.]|nr:gliding motility lipoprotein GldH [Salinimicrobium sp.]
MRRSFFFLLLLGIGVFISCDSKRVYDEYESFPEGWAKDSLATFQIKNIDTTGTYNIFINTRHTTDYNYSNLFLISKIIFPHGKVISDTLEYEMATPSGEWLGTGFGELKESKLWLKEDVRFAEDGTYQITLQQAMRKNGEDKGIEVLEGITEVGIRIEDANSE